MFAPREMRGQGLADIFLAGDAAGPFLVLYYALLDDLFYKFIFIVANQFYLFYVYEIIWY